MQALHSATSAHTGTNGPQIHPRQEPHFYSIDFPTPTADHISETPRIILPNTVFDGSLARYSLNQPCQGQLELGGEDAVFVLGEAATLRNVIIGANQSQGVYCLGSCKIENVWWEAVCEDALTSWGWGDVTVFGGGARDANDKVVQHNGEVGIFYVIIGTFYCTNDKIRSQRDSKDQTNNMAVVAVMKFLLSWSCSCNCAILSHGPIASTVTIIYKSNLLYKPTQPLENMIEIPLLEPSLRCGDWVLNAMSLCPQLCIYICSSLYPGLVLYVCVSSACLMR